MKEESYGVIPLEKNEEGWKVLIVQLHAGHWTYPKGRKNQDEPNLHAAERELLEETGLKVDQFLTLRPYLENYIFQRKGETIDKYAWYYPALVSGTLTLQEEEIKAAQWVSPKEALETLTYLPTKNITFQLIKDLELIIS